LITTNTGKSFISSTLIWTAIVSVAHLFTALIIHTGKLLQLVEIFFTTTVLTIATGTVRTKLTVRFSIF